MGLTISGSTSTGVASTEDIQAALDEFVRFVQEAVLIDGRKYDLYLRFSADEANDLPEVEPF